MLQGRLNVLVAGVVIGSAGLCAGAGALGVGAEPPAGQGAPGPKTVLDHARALPALVATDGQITVPLGTTGLHAWRGVREGITLERGDGGGAAAGLKVAYTRTRGKAAGAALVVRPGDLGGLKSITVAVKSDRAQTLYLNLTQADGTVWAAAPMSLRAGESRTFELKSEDVTLDAFQNRGGAGGAKFDASQVYMLTLLDIGGFMATGEPECAWTVESMKAVLR